MAARLEDRPEALRRRLAILLDQQAGIQEALSRTHLFIVGTTTDQLVQSLRHQLREIEYEILEIKVTLAHNRELDEQSRKD
jgi:hypothetical protein